MTIPIQEKLRFLETEAVLLKKKQNLSKKTLLGRNKMNNFFQKEKNIDKLIHKGHNKNIPPVTVLGSSGPGSLSDRVFYLQYEDNSC